MQHISGLDDDGEVHSPAHKRASIEATMSDAEQKIADCKQPMQKQQQQQPRCDEAKQVSRTFGLHPLRGTNLLRPETMDSLTPRARLTLGQLLELHEKCRASLANMPGRPDWFALFVEAGQPLDNVGRSPFSVPTTEGYAAVVQAFAQIAAETKCDVMLPPLVRIIFDFTPDYELALPPLSAALTFGLGLVPEFRGILFPSGREMRFSMAVLPFYGMDEVKNDADVLDVIISETITTNRNSLGAFIRWDEYGTRAPALFAQVAYAGPYGDVPLIHIRDHYAAADDYECGVYLCPGCYSRTIVQRIHKPGPLIVTRFFDVEHFSWCSNKPGLDAVAWSPQRTLAPWFRAPSNRDLNSIYRRGSHREHTRIDDALVNDASEWGM